MAELHRLEGKTPHEGGALVVFPSKVGHELAWRARMPIPDALAFAKQQAAQCLDRLMREGKHDDAERTNWPSLVAALQRIVMDFNERLRAHIRASAEPSPPVQ